jgi:hypothetical protein
MRTRTTTIAVALTTLAIPCVGTAQATTKADKAQNKLIKKLQHDVKVISARNKQVTTNFNTLVSCISLYDLTWYGDVNNNNTDGYTYVGTDGATFQFTAMAPTYQGDTPNASFMVLDCSAGRANRRFFKSELFSHVAKGRVVAPHRP